MLALLFIPASARAAPTLDPDCFAQRLTGEGWNDEDGSAASIRHGGSNSLILIPIPPLLELSGQAMNH